MLTDIKHLFSCNPLWPAYRQLPTERPATSPRPSRLVCLLPVASSKSATRDKALPSTTNGRVTASFCEPFEIHDRLVTTGEFLEFMNDGGYRRPELWLSLGWSTRARARMDGAVVLGRARRRVA